MTAMPVEKLWVILDDNGTPTKTKVHGILLFINDDYPEQVQVTPILSVDIRERYIPTDIEILYEFIDENDEFVPIEKIIDKH